MGSILADIVEVIDIWLDNLTVKQERYIQIQNPQDRIRQTLLQMRYEGELSTEIQFIANLWIDILNSLSTDNKEQLLMKVLMMFETGVISRGFAYQLIIDSFH